MKLKTKIFISFSLCLTLSFLLLMVTLQKKIVDINYGITEDFNRQLIGTKADDISYWLKQRILEMGIMSESEEFKTRNWEGMKQYVTRLNEKLQYDYGNPAEPFALVDGNGRGWIREGLTIDISQRTYFLEAQTTDLLYTISEPVISKSDQMPIILICYPVYDSLGEKFCYINGSLSLKKIERLAMDVELYGKQGFILDGRGEPLWPNDGSYPLFTRENFLLVQENGNEICTIKDEKGQDHYVLSSRISDSVDWRLCVVVPKSALHEQTNQLIRSVIVIWFLVLFLSIIMSVWLSKVLTRPLAILEREIKEVEKGNFQVNGPIRGSREFYHIGQSFHQMLSKIRELMDQIYREQREKRTAEFQVLQSQINPHFLYNTLDTIRWKAYDKDTESVVEMIDALSDFFRLSLSKGEEMIPLAREVEHVSRYLFIQNIRYEGKMTYNITFDENLGELPIIKLLIQPVVENAIYHGIKPARQVCRIDIEIFRDGERIQVRVRDDGIGMTKDRLLQIQRALRERKKDVGYGLYNVNQRLVLTYGENYGLNICSWEGKGTCVTLILPADGVGTELQKTGERGRGNEVVDRR